MYKLRLIRAILLLLLAKLLFVFIIIPLGILFRLIYSESINDFLEWLHRWAKSTDQTGNVVGDKFFEKVLLVAVISKRYAFGNEDETISSVIGKNEAIGTLSKAGKFLAKILNKIDKGHTQNAIGE